MDVEEGQEVPCVEKKKRKRKIPTPPSPSFCLAAPCNTPNVKIEENRKKKKREKAAKKKEVRFSSVDKQTNREKADDDDDLPFSSFRRPWSAEVEVTPLEFSEHNYKTNAITAKLFAGNIHMGYQEEGGTRGEESVEEEGAKFCSWRELFQSKMDD